MRNRRPYWNCVFSSASFRLTSYSRSSHPRPPPNRPRPPSPARRNGLERTSQSNVPQRSPWIPQLLLLPPQPMGSLEKMLWSHRPAKTRGRPTCKPSYHHYTCACVCSSRNCDIFGSRVSKVKCDVHYTGRKLGSRGWRRDAICRSIGLKRAEYGKHFWLVITMKWNCILLTRLSLYVKLQQHNQIFVSAHIRSALWPLSKKTG